ncbi:hypothetical protein [Nocardia otitidiscaviarum]|uniref:hypothetical protein n=1 Tax=Nocardia otitidiscaviarum TaxID=1823 RepID=UPI001894CB16|nr:hypothetical protein [Nocardia otitidiscaviarum]MBF6179350.1 hypothetical protein [Nocardia otitidiscaviarum]
MLTVAVPALPTIGGFDSGTVAQAVYQILLVMHAQLGITTYGLPPKGNRLRRFHTAFGYANLPLLLAAQLLALFAATAAAADLLAGLLLLTITVHVGLGLVFALRRGRARAGIRPGPPAAVHGTTATPSSR